MRGIVIAFSLFVLTSSTSGQKISLTELASAMDKDGATFEDYLQMEKFEFKSSRDDSILNAMVSYWEYKKDNSSSQIILTSSKKGVIRGIAYYFHDQDEYLGVLKLVQSPKYTRVGVVAHGDSSTSEEFKSSQYNLLFEDEAFASGHLYLINICHCTFSRNAELK